MLVTPVINNAPFPISATFVSYGGPLLIQFAGSAFSPTRALGGRMAVNLKFSGFTVATAVVYTNEVLSHKALVTCCRRHDLRQGGQTHGHCRGGRRQHGSRLERSFDGDDL